MQRFFRVFFLTTIVLTIFGSVFSLGKGICYGFDMGRNSLTKLQGVLVGVNELPDVLEGKLTKKAIIEDIKDELKNGDIKVMTPRESLFSPGAPALLLTMGLLKFDCPSEKDSIYFYSIDLALSQGVLLSRDENIGLHVDSWKTEDVGTISKLDQLREKIRPIAREFVSSYKAANDKAVGLERKESTQPTKPSSASKFGEEDSGPTEAKSTDFPEKKEDK